MLDDDIMQELLVQQQKIIEKEYTDLYEARERVHDVADELSDAQKDRAARLKKRMIELGITKDQFKNGYFKEFNIYDMYKWKGKLCILCHKGLRCHKHRFEKQGKKEGKPYNEKKIYDLFHPTKKGQFAKRLSK